MPAPPGEGSPRSAAARGPARSGRSLLWLLGVVVVCLALILGLRSFFSRLQDDLNARSANERARLFVGEEILRGIHGLEMDLYRMAATTNTAGFGRVRRDLEAHLAKLRHDLGVLEAGGIVRRQVRLNVEGRDEMVSEAAYRPDGAGSGHVMEVVEIGPLLDQVSGQADALQALLERRWSLLEREDRKGFFAAEEEIAVFLKRVPAYFERLDENANRLFFESSQRLDELEAQLQSQRQSLKLAEMGLLALVLMLTGVATVFFVRRINQANDRLEEALEAMRRARDEAERASRAKSEFVSRMSHELRTPLNAIIGFGELLEAEPLQPAHRNYVGLINTSGHHLLELVNQVLDLAKIEAGGLKLERIPFDFPAAVEAVRVIIAERAAGKGIEFVASVSPDLPRHVEGDPTRLRQILINLLVNAVKFTDRGSVELRVAAEGGRIYFSVRDSGIGMDQEALASLFQPFVQADVTVTRRFGGTGLGLVISRELVEAMGGSMEVESAPGTGTCFWFWLPLRPAEAPPAVETVAPAPGVASVAGLVRGKVLLVDDNQVNEQLGTAMLARLGIPCDVARDGAEALNRLAGAEYALVLMDVEMPVMDGITAARRIRAGEAKGRHLPIIAMTANALREDRDRCLDAGMDGFLSKPVSLQALQGEIARVLAIPLAPTPPAPAPAASAAARSGGSSAGWDRATALDLVGGDEALLREVARAFLNDLPIQLGRLEASLAAKDWPTLVRAAHTMKGLFGTFVSDAGRESAAALESAARGPEPRRELLAERVARVRDHAGSLAAALAAEVGGDMENRR
ncbi:MAG: response regulator [Rhodocyclaceae bacterium]|nr:response regulator [Rhodocyclaceae bacterium]